MPELNLGSSESSMFPEIKTGGNGEQVRISNVEHKNVISLVLYIKHYHEKDIKHPFSVSAQLYEWGVAEASSCTG